MIPRNMEGQEKLFVVSELHKVGVGAVSEVPGPGIPHHCHLVASRVINAAPHDLIEGSIITVTLVYVASSPTGVPKQ